jgi:histidine triad (HIT) family protein
MAQQEMSPEQVAELKEKIKNMSPEELREFQKKQCIFCHIVAGKVQSRKVFEDDKTLGILDINPANPGHILLMPKEHYSIMPQMPDDLLKHIFMVAKELSNSVLRALGVQGTNIIVANGVAAGQRANHFMVHIIPRKQRDGLEFTLPQKKHSEKQLIEVRDKLSEKMASLTGKKAAKKQPKPAEKIIDAEFKEEPNQAKPEKTKEMQKKAKPAKDAEKAGKQEEDRKKEGPDKSKDQGISLDDISSLLSK